MQSRRCLCIGRWCWRSCCWSRFRSGWGLAGSSCSSPHLPPPAQETDLRMVIIFFSLYNCKIGNKHGLLIISKIKCRAWDRLFKLQYLCLLFCLVFILRTRHERPLISFHQIFNCGLCLIPTTACTFSVRFSLWMVTTLYLCLLFCLVFILRKWHEKPLTSLPQFLIAANVYSNNGVYLLSENVRLTLWMVTTLYLCLLFCLVFMLRTRHEKPLPSFHQIFNSG
jgi:hypothetical protein